MRTLSTKSKKIIAYMQANPDAKASVIAKQFKVSVQSVYQRRNKMKSAATKAKGWKLIATHTSDKSVKQDMVNHPPHYKVGGIETIDFIEAKDLGYHLGNVVKYISRADHKDKKLENLQKAQWYLNRAIANLEKAK